MLSLPAIFGITLETLPGAPYLVAPAPQTTLDAGGCRKVGLVWAGKTKPRDRSIPLELLLPLLSDPGMALFSLQTGPRAADLKKIGADAFITDLSPLLSDFAETAAMLKQMDLLITVDTAIAHLAGALRANLPAPSAYLRLALVRPAVRVTLVSDLYPLSAAHAELLGRSAGGLARRARAARCPHALMTRPTSTG